MDISEYSPIEDLNLSTRPYNALRRNEIVTIKDLLKYSPTRLLLVRNFGETSLKEVQSKLLEHGWKLVE